MMIPDLNNALPQIAEKNMRPLAVLTKQRSPDLPDVPTLDESVMPGFDLLAWAGSNRELLEARLLHEGAILFRNFQLSTVEELSAHLAEQDRRKGEYRSKSAGIASRSL